MKKIIFIACLAALVILAFSVAPVLAGDNMLKTVLQNEKKLFSTEHDREMSLDELLALGGFEGPYLEKKDRRFAVVDMDQDARPEVVIDAGAYIVLHQENDRVYAYQFGSRQMQDIKKDGSYYGSNSASGGVYLRLKFQEERFYMEKLGEYDEQEGGYEILGQKTSKADFDRQLAELTAPDEVEFIALTPENISAVAINNDGAKLYAALPDPWFPVPMLDGAPLPFKRVSLPEEGYEITSYVYEFSGTGFMESYEKQLRLAGFIKDAEATHVKSFWRCDRASDGASLFVEMSHEGSNFNISMYVNKL